VRLIVNQHRLSKCIGLSAETRGPQAVADHQCPRRVQAIVNRRERPPQLGLHAENAEHRASHQRALEPDWFPGTEHVCRPVGVRAHCFHGPAFALPVEEVRRRQLHPGIPAERLVLVKLEEPIGLREGQRPQQDVVRERERHHRGANPQGGDRHDSHGKSR